MYYFHTKVPYQKPILRQIEWWVQNGFLTDKGVLPVTNLLFWKFNLVQEPLIENWFDVPPTQMPISVLFVDAGVLFGGAFSLWVSLRKYRPKIQSLKTLRKLMLSFKKFNTIYKVNI